MIGTAHRNFLHRLGDAFAAYKAAPAPSQLYPPSRNMTGGWLSFPGWNVLEQQAGGRDEARVKTATRSTSVFANTQTIAHEFASSELMVKQRSGEALEDVENHPLEQLWEAPNPYMGRSYLMSYWAWSYTLAGKSILYWVPGGGAIREVWPVPPFMIAPAPSGKNFIDGYLFRSSPQADPIPIPAELITFSHSINLFDLRDGLSFLVAAMTPIESELAMGDWNRNFFSEQNGVPDGLINVNKDTLDTDLVRIRQELRDFFGGTRRGVAVARAGDMDFKPFGRTQKDAEFIQGIELASKQIGRAMGFPDGYWSESANRANAEQARATMIAGAVWPLLVHLQEDLNAGIVKRWYGEDFRIEFKDIRPENRELKLHEIATRKDYWTIDELRELDGKDPIGDVRGGMLVAEIVKGQPTPASVPSQETEDFLAEQEAALPPQEEAAPPPAPLPDGEAPLDNDTLLQDNVASGGRGGQKAAELERWERKALKSLKRFHKAAVRFESAAIPEDEQRRIAAALATAQTVAEVKAAFDTDTLIDAEWDGALAWAKKVSDD